MITYNKLYFLFLDNNDIVTQADRGITTTKHRDRLFVLNTTKQDRLLNMYDSIHYIPPPLDKEYCLNVLSIS